jgi:hypothetical protein
MAIKDENHASFLEIINAIIPSLNGYDQVKLVATSYGLDKKANNKYYGPKVMIKHRYLILLYVAGRIEFFKTFGLQQDNNFYFSARGLEKVARNGVFAEEIKFERSRAIKDHYSHYVEDGMIIHIQKEVPRKNDPSKTILTDLIALTKKGKEHCGSIIETLLATIPESKNPKPSSKPNVVLTQLTSEKFEKECQSYGLNWLRLDYFEFHKSTKIDFDNWIKGFEFDLPSIKARRELRREGLLAEIKSKLENEGKLMIVGQPGSSKSTILMELMCDYFDAGYEVLFNLGMTDIRNIDGLVNFIDDILKENKKILIAIDNAHNEKTFSIFNFIDKVSNSLLAGNLKIIMTARKPEGDWLSNGLDKVEEGIRKSIRKLCANPNFMYTLPYFTKEEIKEFVKRYMGNEDARITNKTTEIYDYTKGDPIMVKFSVFGKGLEQDVAEMSDRYLGSRLKRKTMLICSILDISNTEITDNLLQKSGVIWAAHQLDGSVLYRNSDGLWKTKHTRWDLELFLFFFNEKSGTLLEERKQDLRDSIITLYLLRDEEITYSVIKALYYFAAEEFVPIVASVVESVFQQSNSQIPIAPSKAFQTISSASNIAVAYYSLKERRKFQANIDRLTSVAIDV